MADYTEIIEKIIEIETENFGPVALEHARKVEGVNVTDEGEIEVEKEDQEQILLNLVQEYHKLVGEAVSEALKEEEIENSDLLENLEHYFGKETTK